MVFDMKSARDNNTMSKYHDSIWRMFIGDKLFISNKGNYNWDTDEDAWNAFFYSIYWEQIKKYIDCAAKFFKKENDNDWIDGFTERIIEKLNIVLKEYTYNER